MDKVTGILFSLSETDKEIVQLTTQKRDIEGRKSALLANLTRSKAELENLEASAADGASRRALEEHRLKEEERKIVERRKQLATIGGAKSAKFMERELDIASRVLQTMEQTALQATDEVDQIQGKLESLRTQSKELEEQYDNLSKESEKELQGLDKEISKLDGTRDKQLEKIDQRLKNLYRKVNNRYPGQAIAIAKAGACRSCFRALPAQLYNQVIAGNMLLQCPGCSRILVHADSASDSKK